MLKIRVKYLARTKEEKEMKEIKPTILMCEETIYSISIPRIELTLKKLKNYEEVRLKELRILD